MNRWAFKSRSLGLCRKAYRAREKRDFTGPIITLVGMVALFNLPISAPQKHDEVMAARNKARILMVRPIFIKKRAAASEGYAKGLRKDVTYEINSLKSPWTGVEFNAQNLTMGNSIQTKYFWLCQRP